MSARSETQKISPSRIIVGLQSLERESLCSLLAVFEDSTACRLIADGFGKVGDKVADKFETWRGGLPAGTDDKFSQRVAATAERLVACNVSDDGLRLVLWAHIRDSLGLPTRLAPTPRDIESAASDIGASVSSAISRRTRAESRASLSKCDKEYWRQIAKDINPLSFSPGEVVPFDQAIREAIAGLLKAALNNNEIKDDKKRELIEQIRNELGSLDPEILKEAGVESLTDEAIKKLVVGGGVFIGLMGAVEAAGFGAYIFAAQASAIIPLVGGKTLVSALFVLSHPLFVLPFLFVTGALTANGLTNGIRKAFAVSVSSLLAVRGLEASATKTFEAANMFLDADRLLSETTSASSPLRFPQRGKYQEEISHTISGLESPKADAGVSNLIERLDQPLVHSAKSQIIERFLFPKITDRAESAALAGVTALDFITELASIHPKVIEAADFARSADLGDPFRFADFAEYIKSLPAASIRGHEANLLGYTAECVVAARLSDNGHIVSIPDSASQPGYDLLVDGAEFQVKCIAPDNLHILKKHFEQYPDIPVIANSEVADRVMESAAEWSAKVFFVEGYTYEFTEGLVDKALDAGSQLGDYELFPVIAGVSIVKNAHGWWVGQQSLNDASFNVAIETAAKGTMAVAGGFFGKGVGALLFGPAGAYVFGGVAAVAATTKTRWITDEVEKALDPKRDKKLACEARNLLCKCIKRLEAKARDLGERINSIEQSGFAGVIRHQWEWERVFISRMLSEAKAMKNDDTQTGEQLAVAALELAERSRVHPIWFQEEYRSLLENMERPKNRWKKVLKLFTRILDKIKPRVP